MSAVDAITAISAGPAALGNVTAAVLPTASPPAASGGGSFGDMLFRGVQQVERKLDAADDMVRRIALGEDLPIHQVSYALEQARLSVELAMQVRSRLLDGYREIMNLQL